MASQLLALLPIVAAAGPAVGILSSPSYAHPGLDFIPASYVSWVESAGAVVVPLPSGVVVDKSTPDWTVKPSSAWSDERYMATWRALNGLLLPGGNPWPQVSSPAFRSLLNATVAANLAGEYFPVWGTCAGFETLAIVAANGCQAAVADGNIPTGSCGAAGPITRGFSSENLSLPLTLSPGSHNSRILQAAPQELLDAIASQNLTFNNHAGGISPERFEQNVSRIFTALATNEDRDGSQFVSLMEGKVLPFYGAQFHPEKVLFEWGASADGSPAEAINHSAAAVQFSRYLASFFVSEARKSQRQFGSRGDLVAASIYRWVPSEYDPGRPEDMREFVFNWSSVS